MSSNCPVSSTAGKVTFGTLDIIMLSWLQLPPAVRSHESKKTPPNCKPPLFDGKKAPFRGKDELTPESDGL